MSAGAPRGAGGVGGVESEGFVGSGVVGVVIGDLPVRTRLLPCGGSAMGLLRSQYSASQCTDAGVSNALSETMVTGTALHQATTDIQNANC